MSKAITLAAALIGVGLGYEAYVTDRTDDTSPAEDIKLFSEVAYYAPFAAAMVEAAYSVTFTYPEDWEWEIYRDFGDMINEYTSTDQENDDGEDSVFIHTLPNRSMMLDQLEELVFNEFCKVATSSQFSSLKTAITQARADTA